MSPWGSLVRVEAVLYPSDDLQDVKGPVHTRNWPRDLCKCQLSQTCGDSRYVVSNALIGSRAGAEGKGGGREAR